MHKHCASRLTLMFGLVLSLAATLSAQGTSNATPNASNKTLVVNGKAVPGGVRQIDGRSYIDVETLAQATNGVVRMEPNRVVLTIPGPSPTSTASPGVPLSNSQDLSRSFAVGAIGEVSEMREWRGAIGAMVTYGLAINGTWLRIITTEFRRASRSWRQPPPPTETGARCSYSPTSSIIWPTGQTKYLRSAKT